MWICPKCGREFKRAGQSHYCGQAPKTPAEYIAAQPPEVQPRLRELADIIKAALPEAGEGISWSMPFYQANGRSVSFAACKKHISLYVGEDAIAAFASRLGTISAKKSALYLPYDRPLPSELIEAIVKWRPGQ